MPTRRSGGDALVALLVVGAVAAVVTAVAGVVLADVYRPGHDAPRSDRWRDWQLWAGVACVLASLLAGVVAVRRRRLFVVACAGVAVLAALVTISTQELVAWDQLALRSVTVGTDVDGYWTAAFGGDVVFVLVGGSEVSQTTYAAVVHLAAPVLGAAALVTAAVAVRRARAVEAAPAPVGVQPA